MFVINNAKDVGVLYLSPIPHLGSRIASHQDKQLESAHAVRYCNIWIQYAQRRRAVAYLQVLEFARFRC